MKYFLVFTPDRGDREDCSVYYSNLITAEVIWGANDLIDWVEKEFVVKIENRFSEDLDDMHQSYEAVIEEIKEKL